MNSIKLKEDTNSFSNSLFDYFYVDYLGKNRKFAKRRLKNGDLDFLMEEPDKKSFSYDSDKISNYKKIDSSEYYKALNRCSDEKLENEKKILFDRMTSSKGMTYESIGAFLNSVYLKYRDTPFKRVYDNLAASVEEIKAEADKDNNEKGWGVWVELDPEYWKGINKSYWFKKNITKQQAKYYASQGNKFSGTQMKGCVYYASRMEDHQELEESNFNRNYLYEEYI